MAYIISELDELEREEFYRLKKVQDKKKKIKKQKEEAAVRNKYETDLYTFIIHCFQAARKAAGLDDENEGGDIFNEEHDEDLLF